MSQQEPQFNKEAACPDNALEAFKISKMSLCHSCSNKTRYCSMVWKHCATDSKIGKSYVTSCTKHNVDFDFKKETVENHVTVDALTDSRASMMGGGFTDTKPRPE